MPLLWHRRLSTLVRETLLVLGRRHRALDQQLPALVHQGLSDTLSSAPMLACEQQCRGLALQLATQSWESVLRRGALYIGNARRETCSDEPMICYSPSDRLECKALPWQPGTSVGFCKERGTPTDEASRSLGIQSIFRGSRHALRMSPTLRACSPAPFHRACRTRSCRYPSDP